jgi:FtsZ-binding cell division protein ZapB
MSEELALWLRGTAIEFHKKGFSFSEMKCSQAADTIDSLRARVADLTNRLNNRSQMLFDCSRERDKAERERDEARRVLKEILEWVDRVLPTDLNGRVRRALAQDAPKP